MAASHENERRTWVEARVVDVSHGLEWLACGWRLFVKSPGLWIVLGLLFVIVWLLLISIPRLGVLVLTLLMPMLGAGFLYAAREVDAGRALRITYLFQGLRERDRPAALLSLGGVALAGALLGTLAMLVLAGRPMMAAGGWPPSAHGLGPGMGFAILVAFVVELLVVMALLYAVPLVMLRGVAAGQAIRSSFRACLRNFLPLVVFGAVLFVLAILASLPLMLGWLVLLPAAAGMFYCSYKDLYETPPH